MTHIDHGEYTAALTYDRGPHTEGINAGERAEVASWAAVTDDQRARFGAWLREVGV